MIESSSSIVSTPVEIPYIDRAPSVVAYNVTSTLIAVSDGRRIVIRGTLRPEDKACVSTYVEERDVSVVEVPSNAGLVSTLCWVGPGHVLCCGTDTGVVLVYGEPPKKLHRQGEEDIQYEEWSMLRYSTAGVVCMERCPETMSMDGGPVLSVGYRDGVVRLFEQSNLLCGEWSVHSVIDANGLKGCTCLSWKDQESYDNDDGVSVPPVVAIGYEGSSMPQLYYYDKKTFRWHSVYIDGGRREGSMSAVSWAPLLGRSHDLIASASGSEVTIWSLAGPLDSIDSLEVVATLPHDSSVWQLGWNMFGNWLAASTNNNMVCLWRPDLAGEWIMLNTITGK